MSDHPIMKCGCAAQGTRTAKDGVPHAPIPACIIHDCVDIADSEPDLTGRIAECSYLPKNHANKPSSLSLAFFEYRGPGSRYASEMCKCGMSIIAHWPLWRCPIRVVRRWYKHDRDDSTIAKSIHAPDLEIAKALAEQQADFFRRQTHHKETEVFSAEVGEITPERSTFKCKVGQFTPIGDSADKYYCGCHGWD